MKPRTNQAATCMSTKLKRNGRGQGTRLTSHQMAPAIAIAMPPLNPPAMRSSHERPRPNRMMIMIGSAAFVCDRSACHSTYSTCHSATHHSPRRSARATLREHSLEPWWSNVRLTQVRWNLRHRLRGHRCRRRERHRTHAAEDQVMAIRDLGWLGGLTLDLKLGGRMLVKYPGLTVVGGLAMAFAIW